MRTSKSTELVEARRPVSGTSVKTMILARLVILLPPYLLIGVLFIAAVVAHMVWGRPPMVIWATMAGTIATFVLTGLTFLVSHARSLIGQVHTTLTTFCAAMWFTIATITGPTSAGTFFSLCFVGVTIAIGWNIRASIRTTAAEGTVPGGDVLAAIFDKKKKSFGLGDASIKTIEAGPHKVKAEMALPAGEQTAEDVIKKAPYIESGMGLPPGAFVATPNEDDASKADVTVIDPRMLNRMIPWPGPYRPGGTIADALRVGMFADATEALPVLPGSAGIQIMGASGSGKSVGGGWNLGAEVITRRDSAKFVLDMTKADQTFGPFRPALHGLHTKVDKVVQFIRQLDQEIPKRTNYLTQLGLTDWQEGCGLLFWVVQIEEASDIFDNISDADTKKLVSCARKIRSAGGYLIFSVQRSVWDQMPTTIRSQLNFWCFPLNDSGDCQYGLSEKQQQMDVNPAEWAGSSDERHLGKAYIHARGIHASHIAVPMRTYAFGTTKEEATAAVAAHAAQWPAEAKAMDEFTYRLAMLDEGFAARLAAAGGPRRLQPDPKFLNTTAAAQPAEGSTPAASVAPAAPAEADPFPAAEGAHDDAADITELLVEATRLFVTRQHASASMLARHMRLPQGRAAQVCQALERKRILGPEDGDLSGKRAVLISEDDLDNAIGQLREDGNPVAEYLKTPDPDPEIVAGPHDTIVEPTLAEDPFRVGDATPYARSEAAPKMSSTQARAYVHSWIRQRHQEGRRAFTASDEELTALRNRTGNKSRGWSYNRIQELISLGVLTEDTTTNPTTYTITDLDPLDRYHQAAA